MNCLQAIEPPKDDQTEDKCGIRLSTSCWNDANGVYTKKSLRYLRRQSSGWLCLEDEASNIGAAEALLNITNLSECEDGIYEVRICNVRTDWETGYADEWDLKLVPVTTSPDEAKDGKHTQEAR